MESASGDAKAKSNGAAAAESSASSTGGGGGHRSSSSSNHHHSGHHNSSSAAAVAHAQAQAQAQAAAALGLLDPSALFAHSLFSAGQLPASYNPMAAMPGYGLLGQGGPSPFAPPPSSGSGSSSNNASLNQANAAAQAAWWSIASQMATQDYMARLQQHAAASSSSQGRGGSSSSNNSSNNAFAAAAAAAAGFPGLSAADSLLASYTSAMNAHAAAHSSGATKSSGGKSRSNPIVRDSLSTRDQQQQPTASTSSGGAQSGGKAQQQQQHHRIPAISDLKFPTPDAGSRKNTGGGGGGGNKSRRRAATTASTTEPTSLLASGSITSPRDSSLSSLSSMAMSYPFFGNPLSSMAIPGMPPTAQLANLAASASGDGESSSKKQRSGRSTKAERHLNDVAALQLLRLPSSISIQPSTSSSGGGGSSSSANHNNNNNNASQSGKARSQTVNGKPLALDVSSLIGKPSTSGSATAASSSDTDAPLNLSMKTKEDLSASAGGAAGGASGTTGSIGGSNSSRLGRGVSMPKKNTVASLLAQSRNQRSNSPGGHHSSASGPSPAAPQAHAASNPSSSSSSQHPSSAEMKAIKDNMALYAAMQELTSGKFPASYLNGLGGSGKDGGASNDSNQQALAELLRAASLLGGFGFGPGGLAGLTGLTSASSGNSQTHQASGSSARSRSKTESDAMAKASNRDRDHHRDETATTTNPSKNSFQLSAASSHHENGQSGRSGNGTKSSHDDTLASDESDSMEEDDSMIDSDDGWAGTAEGESRKRSADGGVDSDGRPSSKKRRFVSDESALRVPLSLGWKRETLIRAIGKSGVRGEVTYYSPSGRRFRQYPDVVRYLERQGVDNIGRDNFSFSTRCIVGEFIQPLDGAATAGSESPSSGGGQEGSSSQQQRGIRLGEPEVRHLVDQIRIARGWKPRSRRMTDEEKEAVGRQREAQRMAQRLEAQEVARQAQEAKLQQRMERERALQEAKEARRQMREQEKLERQEAQRRERELRTQQLVEARKKRQEELDRLREEEQQRKIQELNKQRELFYTAELERERRRQHTTVVKALEARKRYEERERRREELRNEKKLEREKKLEERRKELETWNDQRKPTEDMALTDHKPLPQVPRIENLKLAGQAFADILMLYEFLHTFGETLGFDMDSLPSLDSLQRALLYDSEAEEELLSVMTHLLVCSIEDPGIPHPNRHTTLLGQTLKQADITTTNVSEILRLYLQANGLGDMKLPAADKMSASSLANASTISPAKAAAAAAAAAAVEYPDTEAFIMSEWLKRKPFLSLNPTQKAAILGFMVNELLQNKAVIGQIEGAIEGQNTARRDRWIVDSHIKKLKTLHSRKNRSSFSMSVHSQLQMKSAEQIDLDSTTHDETNHSATGGTAKKKADEVAEADEPVADEPEEDSGAEADDNAADQGDEDEDENLPAEELKRKIERLSRQSAQMLTQLALSDLQLRALNMGQDRFRRRLWILPHAGGVYCEALESGEANAGALGTWDGRPTPPIAKPELELEPVQPIKREMISEKEQEDEDNDESVQQQNQKKKSKKKTKKKKEEVEEEEEVDVANDEEEGKEAIKSQDVEMQQEAEDEKPLVTLNGTTELKESSETNGNATDVVVKKEESVEEETTPKVEVKMEIDQAAEDDKSVVVASSDQNEETEAMKVESSLPTLWFNLFPRSSCDHHSLVHATSINGRDSCSSPTGASEAAGDDRSAPSGKQETVVKEEEKIDMLPIPEEMSRGWWRMVDPDQVRVYIEALHPRGVREKELSRMLTRFLEFAKESCTKHSERDRSSPGNPKDLLLKELRNSDNVKILGGAALPDAEGSWSRETSLRGDLLLLEQIEALEDRVASASMQVKGWKLPSRATSEMNLQFRTPGDNDEEKDDDKVNPIELAKERLLSVEVAIERRYLKAPLGQNKGDLVQSVLSGSCPSADPPKALLTWREAVRRCETAAQVSMCFYVLETSVAWDKSIMKASCQFCHSGDKEDQLLLCDGCDKGYHTYCFRPPMDNIPDGDWFCYECRNKATGQRNCIVCGKAGSKASSVLCDQCPKAYHIECLQPPLAKVPRGKWLCVLCHAKSPGKKKSSKKSSTASEPKNTSSSNRDRVSESETSAAAAAAAAERSAHLNDTLTEVSSSSFATSPAPPASATPPSSTAAPSPRRASSATVAQKRSLNQAIAKEKDLAPCRTILDELEAHDEAWPFLTPVNTKQFPTYKKIIRSPMDLSTIRKKMSDGIFKTRDDFCADIQLMFDNCVTFNEDDSPVGKAGHSMKTFFDSRWAELIAH